MKIDVYTRPDCPYCEEAKSLLSEHRHSFNLFAIGRNITREEVKAKFPTATVLPIIVIDDKLLGGWAELIDWVNSPEIKRLLS